MTTPVPPPPPVTVTVNVPPPPVTVNVPPLNVTSNLPPDVVEKLAPHHSVGDWLYSQGATVLAAVVALGAAYVAWRSVQRQIGADATQVTAQIDGENNREKRKERLDALTSAAAVITDIHNLAFLNLSERDDVEVVREVLDMQLKVATVKAKFDLIGMTAERDAVKGFWDEAQGAKNITKVFALGLRRDSLIESLTKAIED